MFTIKTTGIITDISIDNKTQKLKVGLNLDIKEPDAILRLKKHNKLNIEIKKWYKNRSLDANAYCWVLCDMIAKEISRDGEIVTKENIYKDAINSVGVFEPMIIKQKAYENFKRIWEKQGLGFLIKEVSRKDNRVKVHCYYGSSTYDSKEMSLLIGLLVQEAKELNLETKPQEEINNLLAQWH